MIVIDFERIPGKTRAWTMGHVRAGKNVFSREIKDAGFALVEEKVIDGFKENYFLKEMNDFRNWFILYENYFHCKISVINI